MLVDGKRILRVFPRKKHYVPTDDYAFVGSPPLIRPEADEVHVSCAFSWDVAICDRLAEEWSAFYPVVKKGGPAYGSPGGEFVPGMYLCDGYVITSRGCPFKCEFCAVPGREGNIRPIKLTHGYRIEDSNILACPKAHIHAAFDMLDRHPKRPIFSGGIDAGLLKPWHAELLKKIKTQTLYLAYDLPSSREPVKKAIGILRDAGIKVGVIRCYVLCNFKDDTPEAAEERMVWLFKQGCVPFAMYFRPYDAKEYTRPPGEWARVIKDWTWAKCIFGRMQREYGLRSKDL